MSGAHDSEVKVGVATYWVRRDFDLIKGVEQAFGPLVELDGKLKRSLVTAADLAKLYKIVLAGQRQPPDAEEIGDHIADVGITEASSDLALLVVMLFAGHKKATAWIAEEATKKAEAAGDQPADPQKAA